MRQLGLVCVLSASVAVLAPSLAAAQQAGTPLGDLLDLNRLATRPVFTQWMATRPSAFAGLSAQSRRWMKEEVQRQAEAPRTVAQVALAIDQTMEKDIHRMAKEQRIHPDDVASAVLLKIMMDTQSALTREARKATRNQPTGPAVDAWTVRIAQADVNRKAAMDLQSSVSLAMARD